jgi:hypothetical protein
LPAQELIVGTDFDPHGLINNLDAEATRKNKHISDVENPPELGALPI